MTQDKFIMTFEKAFSDEFCDECILEFEKAVDLGYTRTRQEGENAPPTHKQDRSVDLHLIPSNEKYKSIIQEVTTIIYNKYFSQYQQRFGMLTILPLHTIDGVKIQKTEPGEGYHVWHCEQVPPNINRLLVYTISLNDVEEGGETEFLYQHFRLKQKKGSLTIFPAGFTHTHRGNPPLSGTKYIMTGWISYVPIPE